jgi:hypothetical protein
MSSRATSTSQRQQVAAVALICRRALHPYGDQAGVAADRLTLHGRGIDTELSRELSYSGAPWLTQRSPYGVFLGLR